MAHRTTKLVKLSCPVCGRRDNISANSAAYGHYCRRCGTMMSG